MGRDRDVAAFNARADGYETGWLGELHRRIADRSADLALSIAPAPLCLPPAAAKQPFAVSGIRWCANTPPGSTAGAS